MADINVVSVGTQGPAGPATVTAGAVISARGALITGNAAAAPIALLIGTNGKFLRSDGSDPSWQLLTAADLPTAIDAAKINTGVVSNAEFNHLDGVTSAIQTQLTGKAASAHNHLTTAERGLYVNHNAASSATPSDNTASTTVYAVAMDYAITLPTGTWTVRAIGGAALNHSAAGTVQFRVSVAGQDSVARSYSATSATLYAQVIDEDSLAGQTGTISVYVHFRSITAGTTFAKNPWLIILAERSA